MKQTWRSRWILPMGWKAAPKWRLWLYCFATYFRSFVWAGETAGIRGWEFFIRTPLFAVGYKRRAQDVHRDGLWTGWSGNWTPTRWSLMIEHGGLMYRHSWSNCREVVDGGELERRHHERVTGVAEEPPRRRFFGSLKALVPLGAVAALGMRSEGSEQPSDALVGMPHVLCPYCRLTMNCATEDKDWKRQRVTVSHGLLSPGGFAHCPNDGKRWVVPFDKIKVEAYR